MFSLINPPVDNRRSGLQALPDSLVPTFTGYVVVNQPLILSEPRFPAIKILKKKVTSEH